jgi:hypothetical protein
MSDQNYSDPSLINDDDHTLLFKAAYALWLTQQGGGGGSLPDQTGHAGEFLTTNGTTASWSPVSSSTYSLPRWTWDSLATGAGLFTTSATAYNDTVGISINDLALGGGTNWGTVFQSLNGGSDGSGLMLVFTNEETGVNVVYLVDNISDAGDDTGLVVTPVGVISGSWSGTYQVSFMNNQLPIPALLLASGISPAGDGEQNPVTSITTVSGIVTAKS